MKVEKMIKTYLRCLNCGNEWLPKKKKAPKWCPECRSPKHESITQFELLKEKVRGTTPKQFPYRKNWGKQESSVM